MNLNAHRMIVMKLEIVTVVLVLLSASTAFAFATVPASSSSSSSATESIPSNGVLIPVSTFLPRNTGRTFFPTSIRGGSLSASVTDSSTSLDAVTEANWNLLSERGRKALKSLIENDASYGAQSHVYCDWPEAGVEDGGKLRLTEQLADLDESYPGGLNAYISKARTLLKESAEGVNPFSDFEASVPVGESLSYEGGDGMTLSAAEELGLEEAAGDVVFVLVAGGLGERLGFSGIKLSLGTNLCTDECYLEFYVSYIKALQALVESGRSDGSSVRIPLVIMTSGDTDSPTRQLLKDNDNFGMDPDQIQLVCQDKVAALRDSSAGLSLEKSDRWAIETKPHGHGDVHHLLLREGHVEKWAAAGKKYVVFLQDTNALVVNSVLPTLGVSVAKKFHMNSICIPRLAGEAAGAIARLEHNTDPEKSLVINVEYNQLDPLLSTQGDCKGDVPDPSTGYSPYPGNANNLVLEVGAYSKTLNGEDQGVVVEFVNPKYKDETRTAFKKPTRLECMMQDIPKLFQKEMGSTANIGFTMFDRWFTFSPAKNSLESGVESVSKGSKAPGTMSSAESDMYIQNQRKLKAAGVDLKVSEYDDLVTVGGIPVTPGPRVMICPSFALTQKQVESKFQGGSITVRSSLILDGEGLTVKNLKLDGALVIRAAPGCTVEVDGLDVRNKGWELREVPKDGGDSVPEIVSIRGYTLEKLETMEIVVDQPGKYRIGPDGVLQKVE